MSALGAGGHIQATVFVSALGAGGHGEWGALSGTVGGKVIQVNNTYPGDALITTRCSYRTDNDVLHVQMDEEEQFLNVQGAGVDPVAAHRIAFSPHDPTTTEHGQDLYPVVTAMNALSVEAIGVAEKPYLTKIEELVGTTNLAAGGARQLSHPVRDAYRQLFITKPMFVETAELEARVWGYWFDITSDMAAAWGAPNYLGNAYAIDGAVPAVGAGAVFVSALGAGGHTYAQFQTSSSGTGGRTKFSAATAEAAVAVLGNLVEFR